MPQVVGMATRRLAGLKRENAQKRQQNGMKEMHQHLAQVSSERDALQEKVTDLTVRVRRSNPTTQDALHAARQEIDRLREQLRAANRAITALDTGSDETGTDDPRLTTLVSVELEDHPTDPSREDLSAFALGIAASQPGSNWGP